VKVDSFTNGSCLSFVIGVLPPLSYITGYVRSMCPTRCAKQESKQITTAYRTMFERTQTPTTSVYKGMECRCAGIATLHSRHWYNTWLCVGWMTCEWLTRYEERTIVMISRSVYALSLSRWCRSHCADDRKSVARCLDGAPHARKQNRNIMRRCKG
jgi:hypothetical protein